METRPEGDTDQAILEALMEETAAQLQAQSVEAFARLRAHLRQAPWLNGTNTNDAAEMDAARGAEVPERS